MSTMGILRGFRRKIPSSSSRSPRAPNTEDASNTEDAPNTEDFRGSPPIEGMKAWLSHLGHKDEHIDGLNVIHVAGTKGKGSTCAYVDQFLKEHARRNGITRKIGLYTSPWLWPWKRIRINSDPLPENLFAKRILEVSQGLGLELDKVSSDPEAPGFLQMMALVAFHTFIKEGVNVVICETHHGGEFDATNFVKHPAITAITRIGMDHVDNLGKNIQHIAWHKSGIFRKGVLALSVPQVPEAEKEIRRRGQKIGASVRFVEDVNGALLQYIEEGKIEDMLPVQRENCALATQIAHGFLQLTGQLLDGRDVEAGIENCRWPGRLDIINYADCVWYLDGAHNETSMEVAADWYERVAAKSSIRILIFAHFSPEQKRDWEKILHTLGTCLRTRIQHVIFVHQIEYDDHFTTPEGRVEKYAQLWWENWAPDSIYQAARVKDGINEAIRLAHDHGTGAQILVTGSLYLVEAALEILQNESNPNHRRPRPKTGL